MAQLLAPPGSAALLPRCVATAIGGGDLLLAGAPILALCAEFSLSLPRSGRLERARAAGGDGRGQLVVSAPGLTEALLVAEFGTGCGRVVAVEALEGGAALRVHALTPHEAAPVSLWPRPPPRCATAWPEAVHALACAAATHTPVMGVGPVAAHVWYRPLAGATSVELVARALRAWPFAGAPPAPPGASAGAAGYIAVFNKAMAATVLPTTVAFAPVDNIDILEAWDPLARLLGGRLFFVHADERGARMDEAPPGARGTYELAFNDDTNEIELRADVGARGMPDGGARAALRDRVWRFGRLRFLRTALGEPLRWRLLLERVHEVPALRVSARAAVETDARAGVAPGGGGATLAQIKVRGGASPWLSAAEVRGARALAAAALRAAFRPGEQLVRLEVSRDRVRASAPAPDAPADECWHARTDAGGVFWVEFSRMVGAAEHARLAELDEWWCTAPAWTWRADGGGAVLFEPAAERADGAAPVTSDDMMVTVAAHAPAVAAHPLPLLLLERGGEMMLKAIVVPGIHADGEASPRDGASHHALVPGTAAMRVPRRGRGDRADSDAAAYLGGADAELVDALRLASMGHSLDEAAELAELGVAATDGDALALPLYTDAGLSPRECLGRAAAYLREALGVLRAQAALPRGAPGALLFH